MPVLRTLPSLCFLVGLFSLGGAAFGCRIDDRDIETWKGTVKGPGRLLAVVRSDRYPQDLRVQAGVALIELERQDVEGVAELYTAIKQLPAPQQVQVIGGLAPKLVEAMNDPGQKDDGKAEADAATAPTPKQTRAKDAAYLLVPLAGSEARDQLIQAVIRWYLVDLNGRSLAGNYTAEQVVRSLGAVAAAPMVEALSAKLPAASLVRVSKLIFDVGDAPTKAKAAQRLVDIEREMESPAFEHWLSGQLRAQFTAQGAKVDNKKLRDAAQLNQENFIVQGALPAMKSFASQPPVRQRLMEVATSRSASVERRTQALQALETHVEEPSLNALLNLALDNGTPAEVRDLAFDRVGEIRSKAPIPRLWPLLQQSRDARLRWRAGELILTLGGAGVVNEFFAKMPPSKEANYVQAELEGYATRMGQIAPPPTAAITAAVRNNDAAVRAVGVFFLERRGSAADLPTLQNLSNDSAPMQGSGWPAGQTLGKLAQTAAENLRARLAPQAGGTAR